MVSVELLKVYPTFPGLNPTFFPFWLSSLSQRHEKAGKEIPSPPCSHDSFPDVPKVSGREEEQGWRMGKAIPRNFLQAFPHGKTTLEV